MPVLPRAGRVRRGRGVVGAKQGLQRRHDHGVVMSFVGFVGIVHGHFVAVLGGRVPADPVHFIQNLKRMLMDHHHKHLIEV